MQFFENKFFKDSMFIKDPIKSLESLQSVGHSSSDKRKETDTPIELRRSQRPRKEKHLSFDFISSQAIVFLVEGKRKSLQNKIPTLLNVKNDPKTFSEAMSSRDAAFWKEEVNDVMDSLLSNKT